MLITKQYVVFGKTEETVFEQLCKLKDEFEYAGWKASLNNKYPFTNFTVTNNNVRNNVKIGIYSCVIGKKSWN